MSLKLFVVQSNKFPKIKILLKMNLRITHVWNGSLIRLWVLRDSLVELLVSLSLRHRVGNQLAKKSLLVVTLIIKLLIGLKLIRFVIDRNFLNARFVDRLKTLIVNMKNWGADIYSEIVKVVKDHLVWSEEVSEGLKLFAYLSWLVLQLKISKSKILCQVVKGQRVVWTCLD